MKTCLIVEEAPIIRKVAFRLIQRDGLTVDTVETADEAMGWIEENGVPDLLLISASTSDKSVTERIREICERAGKSSPMRVVALIVEANLGLMTRLRRAGAAGYVLKPFDRQSLEQALAPYLDDAPMVAA